jgi:dUTPase
MPTSVENPEMPLKDEIITYPNVKLFCSGEHKPKPSKYGDACIDLRYNGEKSFTMYKDTVYRVPTKTFVEIPVGFAGIIFERSGLGAINGVQVLGRIVDPGYRGEIIVILARFAQTIIEVSKDTIYPSDCRDLVVNPGDRIAQIGFIPCSPCFTVVESLEELSKTERGNKGLGSTGK